MSSRFFFESSFSSSSALSLANVGQNDFSATGNVHVDTVSSSDTKSYCMTMTTSPWSSSSGTESPEFSLSPSSVLGYDGSGGCVGMACDGASEASSMDIAAISASLMSSTLQYQQQQQQQGFIDLNSPSLSPFYENYNSNGLDISSGLSSPTEFCFQEGSKFNANLFAIKTESTINLNSVSNSLLDDDDSSELFNVSSPPFNPTFNGISATLPELNSADLELLELPLTCDLDVSSPCMVKQQPISPAPLMAPDFQHWMVQTKLEKYEQPISPASYSSCAPSPSSVSSDCAVPQSPSSDVAPRKYPNTKDCLHVAEYLLGLLMDPNTCGDKKLIKWERREKGLFRILKPKDVANKWARAKSNKESMNYPNMARGIRFARVKSGDFELVTKADGVGKKLVYKFSQRFRARNAWLSTFMHPN